MRRPFGKTRAAVAVARAALMLPRWRLAGKRWHKKRVYEQAFYRRIARGFVSKIELRGNPAARPGTLFISNHISWLDIPVIASVIDTEFIAMDDIASWPLVGALSKRTHTLFISRTKRGQAKLHIDQMAAILQSGVNLMLFAEGTTSPGATVLPFISSLFAAAPFASEIRPVFIGYRKKGGARLSDDEMATIGWTDHNGLMPNALGVAGMKIEAVVTVLGPPPPQCQSNRRTLADHCYKVISDGYAAYRCETGQP
ncbi:MAG: lysophospholipid acyltransferase family protein [Sphingomonadaceae bacterium]